MLLALWATPALAAGPFPWQAEALAQARKLLAFFIATTMIARMWMKAASGNCPPSLIRPIKSSVFWCWKHGGHIYKGNYRMRLIYYPMQKECVLMGQEILELANL